MSYPHLYVPFFLEFQQGDAQFSRSVTELSSRSTWNVLTGILRRKFLSSDHRPERHRCFCTVGTRPWMSCLWEPRPDLRADCFWGNLQLCTILKSVPCDTVDSRIFFCVQVLRFIEIKINFEDKCVFF